MKITAPLFLEKFMAFTLLQITQDILNDIDGDFVNSINDTDEAQQVANIVGSTYLAMMSNHDWPHCRRTVNLIPSADSSLPTHMSLEEPIKKLVSIHYDRRQITDTNMRYMETRWKEPDDFLRYTYGRNSGNTDTTTVTDPSGVKLLIMNNKGPEYYTSFDDTVLVFDSWDSGVDSTLQSNKSTAIAYIIPPFVVDDSFVPPVPEEFFAALIEEAKSKSAAKIHQTVDQKAEQESVRQMNFLTRQGWRAHGGIRYPNYGRRRGRMTDPTFRKDNN